MADQPDVTAYPAEALEVGGLLGQLRMDLEDLIGHLQAAQKASHSAERELHRAENRITRIERRIGHLKLAKQLALREKERILAEVGYDDG